MGPMGALGGMAVSDEQGSPVQGYLAHTPVGCGEHLTTSKGLVIADAKPSAWSRVKELGFRVWGLGFGV